MEEIRGWFFFFGFHSSSFFHRIQLIVCRLKDALAETQIKPLVDRDTKQGEDMEEIFANITKLANSKNASHIRVNAVLEAVSAVIVCFFCYFLPIFLIYWFENKDQQGQKRSPAAYFAVLMTTLAEMSSKTETEEREAITAASLTLLASILPR